MGKTDRATLEAIKVIRAALPFDLKCIDSDNGCEFINELLYNYCQGQGIQFTRSRPCKKDDNVHIEQKIGPISENCRAYQRYDKHDL